MYKLTMARPSADNTMVEVSVSNGIETRVRLIEPEDAHGQALDELCAYYDSRPALVEAACEKLQALIEPREEAPF